MLVRSLIALLALVACLFAASNRVEAGEDADKVALQLEVAQLFEAQQFEELEAIAESARANKTRMSTGRWKLERFYEALQRVTDPAIYLIFDSQDRIKVWIAQYPTSPTAHLAKAELMITEAWFARGDGYASSVSQTGWKQFEKHIVKAEAYLTEIKPIASKDPHWYELMLIVAKAAHWPRDKVEALIEEALDREPLDYASYIAALDYYLPKWHGSADDIERFARQAVGRTRATDGMGLYARLYWYAAFNHYHEDLFEESRVVWADLRQGIDDVLRTYPDQRNLNYYAWLACVADDSKKTLELIERIEEPLDEVWGGTFHFVRCKWWAELMG